MDKFKALIRQLTEKVFPSEKMTLYADNYQPPAASPAPAANDRMETLKRQLPREEQAQQPVPTPVADFDRKAIEAAILQGLRSQIGKSPAEQYVPQFVEAAEKYDIFRQNPYLLPQIAILETSGGKNITRPNNLLNWGINYPGNNEAFQQMSIQDVLGRAISGMGERSDIYKDFRTGRPLTEEELMRFAQTYEPANQSYGPNLVKGMKAFERAMAR